MIATKTSIEPQSTEPLPNSTRVYVPGKIHSEVRVPFREVRLSPTKSFSGLPAGHYALQALLLTPVPALAESSTTDNRVTVNGVGGDVELTVT